MTAYTTPQVGRGLLCVLRVHHWEVCSVKLAGHQSNRTRRCLRCWRIEDQALSYFGKPHGPWVFSRYVIPRGGAR